MLGFQEYFGEPHKLIRQKVRKFVESEINSFVNEWEENGEFPKELYHIAGAAGILDIGYHKAYSGFRWKYFSQNSLYQGVEAMRISLHSGRIILVRYQHLEKN